jgi:hypothetical protein
VAAVVETAVVLPTMALIQHQEVTRSEEAALRSVALEEVEVGTCCQEVSEAAKTLAEGRQEQLMPGVT